MLKLDSVGNVIGVEIVSLGKLSSSDLEKLPKHVRDVLEKTIRDLALKARTLGISD